MSQIKRVEMVTVLPGVALAEADCLYLLVGPRGTFVPIY